MDDAALTALHDRALVGAARRQQARIEAQLGSRFGATSPELRRWAVALALTTTLTLTLTPALTIALALALAPTLTLTLLRWAVAMCSSRTWEI